MKTEQPFSVTGGIMRTIHFNCYKIATKIPLIPFAHDLGQELPHHREYTEIYGDCLARILKHGIKEQTAYVFEFGCVTFVNFNTDEIQTFSLFMDQYFHNNKRQTFLKYNQFFSISVDDQNSFHLFYDDSTIIEFSPIVIPTISIALAKLMALSAMEENLDIIFDETEGFVNRMQNGKINIKAAKYAKKMAKVLRFEYDSAYSIRVFERCDIANNVLESRILYDQLMRKFQYTKRIRILQQKMETVHTIFTAFLSYSQSWQENRELYIEIALLALFPLFYL